MRGGDTVELNSKKRAIFLIDHNDQKDFFDQPNFGIDRSIYCHVTIYHIIFLKNDPPTKNLPVYVRDLSTYISSGQR
jgi:hypothetical protein